VHIRPKMASPSGSLTSISCSLAIERFHLYLTVKKLLGVTDLAGNWAFDGEK
jgi:hypothetical protein